MGYLNLVGSFIYKEPLFRAKLSALANNDSQLHTDGWAASSKTLFFQASVPTGWTQDTSQNDKALRVVSTTGGGSGGTTALSSTITLGHTHTLTTDDSHTHALANHTHFLGPGVGGFAITISDYFYVNSGAPGIGALIGYSWTGGGSLGITPASPVLATPGALTLSTLAAHNHGGVTDSQLADVTLAYCDVIIGTKNANSGTYTDLTTYWSTGGKIDFDPFATYAANDAYNYGALMPAGSVAIFVQGSSPQGWTQIVGPNDRMLRIVSGSGGGTGGLQTTSSGVPLMHSHNLTPTVDHTHSFGNHTHVLTTLASILADAILPNGSQYVLSDGAGGMVQGTSSGSFVGRTAYNGGSTNTGAGNTSAAGGHAHTVPSALVDLLFAYLDVIQCSKNSTGAPYSYTDYTSQFAWKELVSYQRLNTLAQNDAYVQYHTTPSGTGMLFFMASPPSGWTLMTSQNDVALRIVTGGSGGSPGGGSHYVSQTITLGHTHTIIATGGHNHAADHTHTLDTATQTANAPSSTYIYALHGTISAGHFVPGQQSGGQIGPVSGSLLESPVADPDHAHAGATGSALTDVSLAYADLIYCTKT